MVNKVFLIGHLGKDPELTYIPSGVAVCKVTMATNFVWKNQNGEQQESTDWHNLVFWRRNAEIANEYLRKGSQVFIEGRISYRTWESNDGVKRNATDIIVQNFRILGKRGEMEATAPAGASRSYEPADRGGAESQRPAAAHPAAPQPAPPPAQTSRTSTDERHYEPMSPEDFGEHGADADLPF